MQIPPTQTILVLIMAILILLSVILVVMLVVRRAREANGKTLPDKIGFMEQSPKCPRCQIYMLNGFTYAPRGLFWRGVEEKAPGLFAPAGKSISNTMNWGFKQKGNRAWRCPHCSFVLIDHSALISQSKKGQIG